MSALQTDLWQRLDDYEIGPSDASLSFVDRLARENRWDADFAERVVAEYKRFCFLACTQDRDVTPSDAVDQVWHLHLTYSRDYWEIYCPEILRTELHHGPTAGGQVERERYYDQYAETLKAYEEAFGEAPPPDIWPDAGRRFLTDPKGIRVNPEDAMILSRGQVALAILAIAGPALIIGWLLGGAQ